MLSSTFIFCGGDRHTTTICCCNYQMNILYHHWETTTAEMNFSSSYTTSMSSSRRVQVGFSSASYVVCMWTPPPSIILLWSRCPTNEECVFYTNLCNFSKYWNGIFGMKIHTGFLAILIRCAEKFRGAKVAKRKTKAPILVYLDKDDKCTIG